MNNIIKNDFVKLFLFILLIACGVLWSNIVNKAQSFDTSAIEYINNKADELNQEIQKLQERQNLGLENNSKKIELLTWKFNKINSFKYNGDSLDSPCEGCYMYLKNMGRTDELKICEEKNYCISTQKLTDDNEKAFYAYNSKQISKEEFEAIRKKSIEKNKFIITEVDRILELQEIPNKKYCYDISFSLLQPQATKKDIHEIIGISKQCYDACKMYIDAEGYLPENYGGCSVDENKKIQEYAKDHPDMFE